MDHREKTSTFFTRLAYGLGRKQRPATIVPPSLGSPAPQTSLIFEFPDELILSILSHVSPDPRLTGHHARFHLQYGMTLDDDHWLRVRFLRPLSMTCRAMQLRLRPWVWGCLVFEYAWCPVEYYVQKLDTIADLLQADVSLAINVTFMMIHFPRDAPMLPMFVKCLKSLPNLHTLEIRLAYNDITTPLEDALKRVKLPQIKTLILPPVAHPLLKHCRNAEDVVCKVRRGPITIPSNDFLESLASNRDSKVKQLAIPLLSWDNPSRFVAACPRLTELTILYPHPHDSRPLDAVGRARSATSELINACKALPDFDVLQIVHFHFGARCTIEQRNQALRDQVKGVKDWAIDCLKQPKTGRREGKGRKKTTLRVIELSPDSLKFRLDSVKVEEYEV